MKWRSPSSASICSRNRLSLTARRTNAVQYFPRFSERRSHRVGSPIRAGLDPSHDRYRPGSPLTLQRRPECLGRDDQSEFRYAGWTILLLVGAGSGDSAIRRKALRHAAARAHGPATDELAALPPRASGAGRTIHRSRLSGSHDAAR